MSDINHIHDNTKIVDSDHHFTINTTTRAISNGENRKLTLVQYDDKSERYTFDIDKEIDGHNLMDCDKVEIHFFNIDSRREKHPGKYTVTDCHPNPNDNTKISFSWLIGQDATMYSGVLSFLIVFKCTEEDKVIYRWSTSIYSGIQIIAGLDNNNIIYETFNDDLLEWQNVIESEYIPNIVDERYINREFATSDEVALIFSSTDPDDIPAVTFTPYEEVTDAEIDDLFSNQGV